MNLSKRSIVNFLFVLCFPAYGFGEWYSVKSPTIGFVISVLPLFFIIAFHLLDLLYKKEFEVRMNGQYFLVLFFLISASLSLYISLQKHLPETNGWQVFGKSLLIFIPIHAFIPFYLYNEKQKEIIPKLTLLSMSLLLLINVVGFYGLGMTNGTHNLEGRINFPFLGGLYTGACLLAIINLMLLFYIPKISGKPLLSISAVAYFGLNILFLLLINSRIVILIFLVVFLLFLFKAPKKVTGIYLLSLFTIPILMSMGILIYRILTLPFFVSILKRVDKVDVTTFNGRAFLWQDAIDWLFIDQRGLFWGNGYKGHYFINLLADVAKLWNEKYEYHLHLHSTVLEVAVSQGLIALIVLMLIMFLASLYYRKEYLKNGPQSEFFAITIFLLFIMQVDMFVYWDSLGFLIFSLLVANFIIKKKNMTMSKGIEIKDIQIPALMNFSF
jgi:O-antigen ligase